MMSEKSINIKVIDNVLNEEQIANWCDFYKQMTFRRSATESNTGSVYFCRDIFYKELIEIFDYENNIYPHVKEYEDLVTPKVFRSYINIFNEGDKFEGHKDLDHIPAGKHSVSCVLFLNPEWKDTGGGLAFEQDDDRFVVQNKFNRLVIFHADIWHQVQKFHGNKARITLYTQFNNAIPNLQKLAAQNKW